MLVSKNDIFIKKIYTLKRSRGNINNAIDIWMWRGKGEPEIDISLDYGWNEIQIGIALRAWK